MKIFFSTGDTSFVGGTYSSSSIFMSSSYLLIKISSGDSSYTSGFIIMIHCVHSTVILY